MADPTVKVGVFADASQLDREMARAQGKVTSFGDEARRSGDILRNVLFGGAVLYGAKKVIDAASALQQSIGGTGAVFGEASSKVDEFSKNAAELAGLSESAARTLTSQLGASLKGFGLSAEEAADKSVQLAQVGADLAATMGGSATDAVSALGAAFRGEFDPLERFGIALKQSDINAKAVAMGLADSESDVSSYAKGQAALALITERSAFAQGQFARESDTAAGAAQIASAQMQNATADLGTSFLPIYSKIAEVVGKVAEAFAALPDWVQTAAVALAGVALIGPKIVGAVGAATEALKKLPAAFDRAAVKAYDAAGAVDNFTSKHKRLLDGLAGAAVVVGGAVAAWQIYQQAIHSVDDDIDAMVGNIKESAQTASYDELVTKIEKLRQTSADFDRERSNSKSPFDADYRDQLIAGANALDRLAEELGGVATVTKTVAMITGDSTDEVLAWIRSQSDAGITYSDAKVALMAYTGEIDTNGLSAEDAKTAQEGFAQGIRDVISAQKEAVDPFYAATQAQQRLKDAQLEAFLVSLDQNASTEDQAEASLKATEAAFAYDAALLALAESTVGADGGIENVKASLERMVDQGLITREDADRTIAKFQEVGTEADSNLYDRGFRVTADTSQAMNAIEALKASIINFGLAKTNPNVTFTEDDVSRFLGNRAAGGPVQPWSAYRVHDTTAPELLSLSDGTSMLLTGSQPGYITNLGSAASTPASGGAPTSTGTTVFQFTGPINLPNVTDPDGFVNALQKWVKVNGPLPVPVAA